jgi:hypothetical protein
MGGKNAIQRCFHFVFLFLNQQGKLLTSVVPCIVSANAPVKWLDYWISLTVTFAVIRSTFPCTLSRRNCPISLHFVDSISILECCGFFQHAIRIDSLFSLPLRVALWFFPVRPEIEIHFWSVWVAGIKGLRSWPVGHHLTDPSTTTGRSSWAALSR